jgi:hypothetical protein
VDAAASFVGKSLTLAVILSQLPDKPAGEYQGNRKQRKAKNGREELHVRRGRI